MSSHLNPLSIHKPLDIAIIGAGPQALTLVTHLLQKKKTMRSRFQVFDPSGQWLTQWHRQFAAQEIPHLRSPAVHHPDPKPQALLNFADRRYLELHNPYNRPGTSLFRDFCERVIEGWQLRDRVLPAQVTELIYQRRRFALTLDNGQKVIARRVVLAVGNAIPKLPDWAVSVDAPPGRLCHSTAVDLRNLPSLQGETVLIVGSGLTSGHLAIGAVKRGARVLLMARRRFQEKIFDAAPGWLGPKYLKGFHAETDWHQRSQMIQQARDGGSLTPDMLTKLRRLSREDKVTLYEHCQVKELAWTGNAWQVHCQNYAVHDCLNHQSIDRIWLATGNQLDVANQPLLKDVMARYPVEIVNGVPVLDKHLRWPGCELFLMGPWAALQVGPVARNLFGGKLCCDRIVPALIKQVGLHRCS
ncbi:SidA/IucD/PvdA family monooxygenase [Adonisia turfae]|uniref:SidA/IucD/PvdA family monooxygenase n=1 Tax=Adonisia turfae TaxID=2950184 RepID=UPI002029AF8E|nr:FAD/NAD(P)-binding protein [Adonisia turfae]